MEFKRTVHPGSRVASRTRGVEGMDCTHYFQDDSPESKEDMYDGIDDTDSPRHFVRALPACDRGSGWKIGGCESGQGRYPGEGRPHRLRSRDRDARSRRSMKCSTIRDTR